MRPPSNARLVHSVRCSPRVSRLDHAHHLLAYADSRRSVTARLCACSPSSSAILATEGPSSLSPSRLRLCTVIFFWNESRDTPLRGHRVRGQQGARSGRGQREKVAAGAGRPGEKAGEEHMQQLLVKRKLCDKAIQHAGKSYQGLRHYALPATHLYMRE